MKFAHSPFCVFYVPAMLTKKYLAVEKDSSATHNFGNPYQRPEVRDPPLTELGRQQARALRERAQQLNPEVVVVSPMCRATQTALLGFSHLLPHRATENKSVPFIAHEGLRELCTCCISLFPFIWWP